MGETRQQVREAVLYRLGDSDAAIWSVVEVNIYIQEGLDDLARLTYPLWDYYYCNDVASTATYELPDDVLMIDRVTWDNRRIPPVSAAQLRRMNAQYRTEEGDVVAYSVEEDGIKYLRKYLIPSVTATADQDDRNTRVEYFQRPAVLADDADELDLPRYACKYVRWFALWRCLERKGRAQDLRWARHFRDRYFVGVDRLKRRRESVNDARVGRLGGSIGYESRRVPAPRLPWAYGRVVRR